MASTTLSITYSSAGNRDKWTWSGWVKRSKLGGHQSLWSRYADSNNIGDLRFQSDDGFTYQNYNNGSTNAQWNASGKFRDTNAWYHIVFVWDSGNATAADRMKAYVNGEDMPGSASTTPSQDLNSLINASASHKIGSRNSDQYFDGLMSHVHFCDGYAYSPTDFGETDSTTGEWKIKTEPSVSYGTNGYFMFKDDASVNDDSGNDNDFTASGTLTPTEDNPSNNFATMNPLHRGTTGFTNVVFKHGATTVDNNESGSGVYPVTFSSLAMSSGKFYCEMKVDSMSSSAVTIGIEEGRSDTIYGGKLSTGIAYKPNGEKRKNDTSSSYGNTWTNSDIIGVALDLDNNYVYFSKNGTWQNSGDPTSGSSGTGGIAVVAPSSTESGVYHFSVADNSSSGTSQVFMNFGNGYFGSTAISSEGTNASGIGKFEYNVPTGYTALCTKGLNE